MLIISVIPTVNQLKYLLTDLEKTSSEARDLVVKLKDVSTKVERDVEKFDAILDSSKETIENVSSSIKFVNKKILKHSAGLFALIPAIKMGWDLVKKIKAKGGKKNV
jgi:ABC-type transporter Mla subunit MlaD